jgi:hypothetical protein
MRTQISLKFKTVPVAREAIMVRKKRNKLSQLLERFSLKATKATGTSMSFILALSVIIVWGFTVLCFTSLTPGNL